MSSEDDRVLDHTEYVLSIVVHIIAKQNHVNCLLFIFIDSIYMCYWFFVVFAVVAVIS